MPGATPAFSRGDKLVLAAPAHSGLPAGASAVVAACTRDKAGDGWLYDLTLTGGGKMGSDVQVVRAVPEGWLRSEGRIASAKSCAPVRFGSFVLSAARLVVPLFQRRYCWDDSHWMRLWKDVLSPSSLAPHALGRVVFVRDGEHGSRCARDSGSLVLLDGQQRCITLFLLLCAMRDVADNDLSADHSASIVASVERILFTRRRRLTHASSDSRSSQEMADPARGLTPVGVAHSIEQAGCGLESLPGAEDIRLIPSRQDRLPFCSLACRVPFDASASRAARTMHACHDFFLTQARRLVSTTVGATGPPAPEARSCGGSGLGPSSDAVPESERAATVALRSEIGARVLSGIVTNCLMRVTVVALELDDRVALNNT